ncbi:hypothetical protein [Granulicella sp. S156]|jgi:uncharacterized protein involved in exopolysaccharide biosynthesis|uniref:hypothetical protein n=1 Tax=Granulicella sp. S156 TaxID=1747224 RepID=UPI00131B21DF|nr:hypothetical protein [Granulicella sp. S156]
MSSSTISVDEFQALEQKVLQTVELIKKEREARAVAESERDAARTEAASLREKLSAASGAQAEVESLNREREAVKSRVEKMLAQMDELL